MVPRPHSVTIDDASCIGCVDCVKVCPTRAIRVRSGRAVVNSDLCIDCGSCIRACRVRAARPVTSSPEDLARFRYTVALPSLTFYGQFGRDADPLLLNQALTRIGFDTAYDMSWMCEMLAGATDAYLSECAGPWPKLSVTCPAIVRLIQIRYPDMLEHLVPIESPRELAAKLLRRKLAVERGLDPKDVGIFFITPCTAIINSIRNPVGLDESYLDGAFAIRDVYGMVLRALKDGGSVDTSESVSRRGILWAMAGGQIAGMRSRNTITVKGVADVLHVFDHIEAGKLEAVDFIEAYICPDGCVSGQLVVEERYAAQRNVQAIVERMGAQPEVSEEKVRSLLREHFFELEEQIMARPVRPLGRDLREAVARKREVQEVAAQLPRKDCAACGAPDCATLAEDVVRGEAKIEDCVFVRLETLEKERTAREAS
jgi:iron only hydrogenase large subunit-like protein